MADISAIKLPDGNSYDIKDKTSGYITGMTILSYGNSTWQDFIDAYEANKVVYCRASSNSNPASGSQTRLAFMAYVNNATTPTEVEFQYYRSVSSHSDSQQGDQVYVYKLNKTNGWSVTVREAYSKIANGTGISKSYSNGTITLSGFSGDYSDLTNKPTIPSQPSDIGAQEALVSGTNIKTINNTSILGSGDISVAASGTSTPTADTVAEFDSDAHMNSTDMTSQEVQGFVDDLDLPSIQMADYIVEEGSSGAWSWVKYKSGRFEAWRDSTAGATGTLTQISSSNIWYSAPAETTFPSIGIQSIKLCEVSCAPSANYLLSMGVNRVTTSSCYPFYIRYGSSTPVTDIHWWVHLVGTYA